MAEVKVGLEVHGYLNARRKLFCLCKIEKDAEPNTNICPVCTAQPGSKPMLPSKEALDRIIAIGLMLDCRINSRLLFQRKHYSWPDLPAGYQRTISGSYSFPVGVEGSFLGIGIADVHLEEDPARWEPETGFVDYNRSGYPLAEIVTKPDFTSSEQVREWVKRLVTTLSYIKAVDPGMGIKCDVNISIPPAFLRVEVKNVNSIKSIAAAIEHEAARQERIVKQGKAVGHETRAWNEQLQETVFMRRKEQAMDYMYIPEPDLPVIDVSEDYRKSIAKTLPERPHEKKERYVKKLGVDATDADVLSSEFLLAELFEKVAAKIAPVLAARWLRRELLRVLHYNKKELFELELEARHIIALLRLVESRKISEEVGRRLLEQLAEKPFEVEEYVKKEGLAIITGSADLEKICSEVLAANEKAVQDYLKGEEKALNFLLGQVMAKTKGRADARKVRELIISRIIR